MKNGLFIATVWLLATSFSLAQSFDVFYLSVGSTHYVQKDIKEGCEPFADVNGARKSARYMHELFSEKAGGTGTMLRSEQGKELSREAILNAFKKTIATAKKSKAKNPLVVFYFCGHGVSEGIGWSQFLVPGTFNEKPPNIGADPIALDLDYLADKLIYVGDITDIG